jgi:hypothetical protein
MITAQGLILMKVNDERKQKLQMHHRKGIIAPVRKEKEKLYSLHIINLTKG